LRFDSSGSWHYLLLRIGSTAAEQKASISFSRSIQIMRERFFNTFVENTVEK